MKKYNDNNLHFLIGSALRIGVIISMSFMIIGGVAFLLQNGQSQSDYSTFKPFEPSIRGIYHGIITFESKSVIYLGIMLLIGTPVMRVALSVLSFALERDLLYTAITFLVLSIIVLSIISGHPG